MTPGPPGWTVERRRASAAALHEEWPEPGRRHNRVLAICEVEDRALVLGSTQPLELADDEVLGALGVSRVRRRSGGGALLVGPAEQLWIDAWVPRGDPLWDDDVVRGAWWFGESWARALRSWSLEPQVHRAHLVRGRWGATVCFAGLGPGEVTVGGRKVVGLAQRRVREGARLMSMVNWHWDPLALVRLLTLPGEAAAEVVADTAHLATGLDTLVDPPGRRDVLAAVEEAVVGSLQASADGEGPEKHR